MTAKQALPRRHAVSRRLRTIAMVVGLALAPLPSPADEPGGGKPVIVVGGDHYHPPYEFLDEEGRPVMSEKLLQIDFRGPEPVRAGNQFGVGAVAGDIEGAFAKAGHIVVSNARNFRMDPVVPLLIPEINADHLALIGEQRRVKCWPGAIVTNPNCSTIVLAMALAPLRPFNVRSVIVSTMQAVSGAGYPGVPSLDILGNVVPFIGGEEEKMQTETLKILGSDGGRTPYPAMVSAHTNRVAVLDGHTMTVSVGFEHKPSIQAIVDAMRSFAGKPQELWLPSAPHPPVRPWPTSTRGCSTSTTRSIRRIATCSSRWMCASANTSRSASPFPTSRRAGCRNPISAATARR